MVLALSYAAAVAALLALLLRRGRRVLVGVAVAAAGVTVLAIVPTATAAPLHVSAALPPGAAYAAFGDSYSSGEGSPPYLPGTAVPGANVCHRSPEAYSGVLDGSRDLGPLGLAACSGGVTADLFGPNSNRNRAPDGMLEPAQLCTSVAVGDVRPCGSTREPVLGPGTRTVTLTIGGNDVGLARIVRSCLFTTAGPLSVPLGSPGRGCSHDPLVLGPAALRIAALDGIRTGERSPYGTTIHSISSVLTAIHAIAPDAHVYVGGYPQVLQPQGDADCVVGHVDRVVPVEMAAADARLVDSTIASVGATVSRAAAKAGPWVTYVDPQPFFAGHGLCTAAPWINPLTVTVGPHSLAADSGSFHPTPAGQADGYAAAFAAAGIGS